MSNLAVVKVNKRGLIYNALYPKEIKEKLSDEERINLNKEIDEFCSNNGLIYLSSKIIKNRNVNND